MKFTDLFVKRPVLAIVVNLVILIAGLQSIRALSVRQYPRSDISVVRVATVYVGANADLVRGFITTPLERVIASADGIDYMESSSAQSLSTITVHLKLNYDTNDALTQIQAKVAQVRNDLPPEAEAPTIQLETADTQFAAIYLGFSSPDLDQTQITDYLTRVVQPKLSAISGVQRADILGDRTFAMRVWLKPDQMAAHGISPSALRDALARNNYLSALGRTKGSMVSVNLIANTDLRTPEEFRQLVVKEKDGVVVRLGDVADVVLGAENYDEDVRFNGETAVFMGVWVLPTANSLDVIREVREAMPGIQAELPAGMQAGIPYDSTAYIQDAINEVLTTLTETLLIVIARDLPVPRFGARRDHPGGRDSDLARRRGVPDAGRGLHDQPADAARDRALGRPRGRRCDRDGGEHRTPFARRQAADAGRARGGARAGRPDRRHDHHAGGGLRADRHPGRPHRRAVPRIRVHARRRGDRLRRRGADAVADDGLEAAARGRYRTRLRRLDQSPVRQPASRLHARARRLARLPAGGADVVADRRGADRAVLHVLAEGAGACRRSGRGVLDHPGRAERHDRADQALCPADQRRLQGAARSCGHLRADVPERRVRRHGDEAVERTHQDRAASADGGRGSAVADCRRARVSHHAAGAAGRRRLPGRSRDRLAGRAAAARRDRRAAGREGVRERTVHVRRRRLEVRSAAGGGRLRSRQAAIAGRRSQPGRTRSVDSARRRLRQSLQHPGTQLQGHPADRAGRTVDARSAVADLHHGFRRQAGAALDVCDAEDHGRSRAS